MSYAYVTGVLVHPVETVGGNVGGGVLKPEVRDTGGSSIKKCGLLRAVWDPQKLSVGNDMIKGRLCLLFFPDRHGPWAIISALYPSGFDPDHYHCLLFGEYLGYLQSAMQSVSLAER